MTRRARVAPFLLLVALSACGTDASDEARGPARSVLVDTVRPQRGALPAIVTAYGSVAPSVGGTQTLSEAQPGQVTRLLVAVGSVVRAGQPLATFVTAPAARSAYDQAVSALAAARKQRATTAQLLAAQLATQDQQVQADKAVSDAQTALAALLADGAGAPVRTVVAPFAGVVTAAPVAQGDRIQAGAALLTIARSGGIVVSAGVDPAQRAALAVGQAATVTRLSGGPTLAGRVIRVDGALNPQTRLVDVDVQFPGGSLLPGESMQVGIATATVGGWVVPHAAVVATGGPTRVFQILGGKAHAVPVRILLSSDRGDVVDGSLAPDRPLIVAGAYQVQDGDAVRRGR
nr:efflux RND transporter periplasmic adaptor subunit [Sphingomonas sp. CARO-RG-8B-R24-01]